MLTTDFLREKLKRIDQSEYDEESKHDFRAWFQELDEIDAIAALQENFVLVELLKRYKEQIEALDDALLNKRGLEKNERDLLLDKKQMLNEFIQSFSVKDRLNELELAINAVCTQD